MRQSLLLVVLLLACGTCYAGAASSWQMWGFDGSAFVKDGPGGPILVRDGYLPVPGGASLQREDPLPQGTGAVALFCYQQRSGGKLRNQGALAPMPGLALTVKSRSLMLAARTDENGYLILALPPGKYELQLAGLTKTVTVEKGKTSLAALRGGKRMVD
jgi:hypothetical protein